MPFVCTISDPLTVEIRDGETMTDALLRELRATTAALAHLHNMLIGDDTTPGGERLRREVVEAVRVTIDNLSRGADALWEVHRKLERSTDRGPQWNVVDAVLAELGRVTSFNRSPLALLPARSTWADTRSEEVACG